MQFPTLKDSSGQYHDQVQLTGMLMSCVIGIFPSERHRKQPVTIDLCLYFNSEKAAKSTNIHDTIDYGSVVTEITFILDSCEFLLIESAVETICQYFLATYTSLNGYPQVEGVVVKIAKPSALTHGIIPAVQVLRRRQHAAHDLSKPLTLHCSEHGKLVLASYSNASNVTLSSSTSMPTTALTIGRWTHQEKPLKPRSVVTASDAEVLLTPSPNSSQLILLSY